MENMYIENFIACCKVEKTLSQKTLKAYSIDLRQFVLFLIDYPKDTEVIEVDKSCLIDYI